jgi:hypothetical protein
MTRRVAWLSAVVLAVGCGTGAGKSSSRQRSGAARAALTVAPNPVSCSSPAAKTFTAALCVCEDLDLVGRGVWVTSSDAKEAPAGVNGVTHVVGETTFASGLASWGGVTGAGTLDVGGDLVTPADVDNVGTTRIGGDVYVGGNMETVGDLSVGGVVRVRGRLHHVGAEPKLTFGPYSAPAGPPCGCEPSTLLDVAAAVAAARTDNDNASLGSVVVENVGELTLTLDGGRYYLPGLSSVGSLHLKVTKPSALYIDGDFRTVGDDSLSVAEGASLDLYVNGSLENVGTWKVSDETLAGVVRLFVGGKDGMVQSVGDHDFVGALYAPTAPVELVGDTRFRGALFVKRLDGVGELTVDYAAPAMPEASACSMP